jgi:hypothetical protein
MIDRDAILAALGREIDWHIATPADLVAPTGEPADRTALARVITDLLR